MRGGVCAVGEGKWAALGGKTLAVLEQETVTLGYGVRWWQDDELGKTTIMAKDE